MKNIKKIKSVVLASTLTFSVLLILGVTSVSATVAPEEPVVLITENSFTLCHDGIDNDDNGTTDMGDRNCANFTEVEAVAPDTTDVQIENSFTLCHDGIDNDDNGTTDMGDRNCANFTEVEAENPEVTGQIENSYELCHDGIDNDDNGTTDMGDRNCATYGEQPVIEEPATSTPPTETRRRSSGGGSRKAPSANLSSSEGEVLGDSTEAGSCKVLTTFMKIGQANNVEEVKMLQTFLNAQMSAGLPVTGFFGPLTLQAVKDFQVKHKTEILKPWVDLGLMANDDIGTGYVYKTTQYAINKTLCPESNEVYPTLN
jgi:hypothetical protein